MLSQIFILPLPNLLSLIKNNINMNVDYIFNMIMYSCFISENNYR